MYKLQYILKRDVGKTVQLEKKIKFCYNISINLNVPSVCMLRCKTICCGKCQLVLHLHIVQNDGLYYTLLLKYNSIKGYPSFIPNWHLFLWHLFHEHLFLMTLIPKDIYSYRHLFLQTFIPVDIYSYWHLFLMTFIPTDIYS